MGHHHRHQNPRAIHMSDISLCTKEFHRSDKRSDKSSDKRSDTMISNIEMIEVKSDNNIEMIDAVQLSNAQPKRKKVNMTAMQR
mmetsp:Transcript_72208/g.172228  ORF Transcript_72208/g.172228 Transcript_72208/m.172228 type:complete len:84 (+) Transcript_72208:1082-1333(+)